MIGGTGSLELPGLAPETVADSREAWLAFRRTVADSKASTQYMVEKYPPIADASTAYRKARQALLKGQATDADLRVIKENEDPVLHGENPVPDLPLAARATFMMLEGDESFKWSFVSPPGWYRPGPRTGKYDVYFDEVPLAKEANFKSLDGNPYEGRLLGISAADLGVAVADEIEKKEKVYRHWSAVSEWDHDEPATVFAKIDAR